MKRLFVFLLSVGSVAAFAADVSLRVPLLANIYHSSGQHKDTEVVPLAHFNPLLKKHGLEAFPENLVLHATVVQKTIGHKTYSVIEPDAGDLKAWDHWNRHVDRVNDAIDPKELGGQPLEFASPLAPEDLTSSDGKAQVCYQGDPLRVGSFVQALADRVFSDQLGVFAWRYQDHKWFENTDVEALEHEFPKLWRDWRGRGEAVLVLTHYGDDGTDQESNIVRLCE